MTVDGRAQEGMPDLAGGSSTAIVEAAGGPMPVGIALDLCDRLLGEIGRRQHRFSWLRPPGTGIEDCLVCDAYYPGHRLVAICRHGDAELDALYAEQVPGHGLQLLVITLSELGMDRLSASEALVRQIGALGPLPDRPRGPEVIERPQRPRAPGDGPLPRLGASFARASAPLPTRPRRGEPARAAAERVISQRAAAERVISQRQSTPEHEQRFGMLIGLALALVVAAEALVLVAVVALGGGHPLLAFGFALDACARALGTITAAREAEHGWAWSCMILGSPAVVSFVLLGPDGAVDTEPGPFAGVVSVLAIGTVGIAVLGALIGI